MDLIFVTGNKNKLKEAQGILQGIHLTNEAVDLPELQGTSEEIIREKARVAFSILKKPCFVEDTSFGFEAWNWMPGPYIKDFLKVVGAKKLSELMMNQSKNAKISCWIGYAKSETDIVVLNSEIEGTIVPFENDNGFGFDPIFIPKGHNKRYAEMDDDEKNSVSHRFLVMKKLKSYLDENV